MPVDLPDRITVCLKEEDWKAAEADRRFTRSTGRAFHPSRDCALARAIRRAVPGHTIRCTYTIAVFGENIYHIPSQLGVAATRFDDGLPFIRDIYGVLTRTSLT